MSGLYTGGGSGEESDHRHLNISSDKYNALDMTKLYYDYEEIETGSWSTSQRFFLYAPSKWPMVNWKNNPFEVSK